MSDVKKIDFEAHFYTKEYVKVLLRRKQYPRYEKDGLRNIYWMLYADDVGEPHTSSLFDKLLDLGVKRLKDMDEANVTMQVLSLSAPGVEQLDAPIAKKLARKANDELSSVVEKYPERFLGLATLAPQDSGEAADELERAVKELGLVGWKTHSNYGETYLDDKKYWPILEKVEKLKVPIYLHPTGAAIPQLRTYGYALAGPSFGFGVETATCMMRLILSGVFDEYPDLKVILGHFGEGLPFLFDRMDFVFTKPWVRDAIKIKLRKKPSEYIKDNVFITTSGTFLDSVSRCAIQIMGVEKVLFATDYPYEDSREIVKRIEKLLTDTKKNKIYYLNAEKLLNKKLLRSY